MIIDCKNNFETSFFKAVQSLKKSINAESINDVHKAMTVRSHRGRTSKLYLLSTQLKSWISLFSHTTQDAVKTVTSQLTLNKKINSQCK